MDPYTAMKLVEINQQSLAKSRGHHNWKSIFKK